MVTMTRWNPLREMLAMQHRLNHLMDESYGGQDREVDYGSWMPPVDLREEESQFVIQVDLPGMNKKDIEINRGDSRIIITVEFTKEVDLLVYTYQWHKVIHEDRPLF